MDQPAGGDGHKSRCRCIKISRHTSVIRKPGGAEDADGNIKKKKREKRNILDGVVTSRRVVPELRNFLATNRWSSEPRVPELPMRLSRQVAPRAARVARHFCIILTFVLTTQSRPAHRGRNTPRKISLTAKRKRPTSVLLFKEKLMYHDLLPASVTKQSIINRVTLCNQLCNIVSCSLCLNRTAGVNYFAV